jgi:hypothetical protein
MIARALCPGRHVASVATMGLWRSRPSLWRSSTPQRARRGRRAKPSVALEACETSRWRRVRSSGLAVVLLGLGVWLAAASGEPGTVAVVGAAAVVTVVMVATLPARARRAAWRATSRAPKELLVYADGLLLEPRWDPAAHALVGIHRDGRDATAAAADLGRQPAGRHVPQARAWRPAAVPRLREYLATRVAPRATRAGAANTTPNA